MKHRIFYSLIFISCLFTVISSCQSEAQLDYDRYYSTGSIVYQTKCQNCHGLNGEGLGELIPALTDTVSLKQNKSRLACFVSQGLKGSVKVNGRAYNGIMPAQTDLSPIEIAQVLTYLGNSFGNKIGLIDVQQVEKNLKGCN